MSNDRTDKMYEWWQQAIEKYDSFVAGVCLAVTGYVGQNLAPARLGINPGTMEALAVLVFTAASFFALKRMETTAHLLRLQVVRAEEADRHLTLKDAIAQGQVFQNLTTGQQIASTDLEGRASAHEQRHAIAKELLTKVGARAPRWTAFRDWLLIAGFLTLLGARVWAGQQPPALSGSEAVDPGSTQSAPASPQSEPTPMPAGPAPAPAVTLHAAPTPATTPTSTATPR